MGEDAQEPTTVEDAHGLLRERLEALGVYGIGWALAIAGYGAAVRVEERAASAAAWAEGHDMHCEYREGEARLRGAIADLWVADGIYRSAGCTNAAYQRHVWPALQAARAALEEA